MKNVILTFILSFFIIGVASSQSISFSVKGGMNISNFNGDSSNPFAEYSGKVGFHIGGIVEVPLFEKFSLQPELLYSNQGATINSGERKFNMHYLQLPILGKYSIGESLSLEAGPVFGYLLSAKYEATLTSEGPRE